MAADWHRSEEGKIHKSRCVHNFSLVNGICSGCFRTPDECDRWHNADIEERIAILQRTALRRSEIQSS